MLLITSIVNITKLLPKTVPVSNAVFTIRQLRKPRHTADFKVFSNQTEEDVKESLVPCSDVKESRFADSDGAEKYDSNESGLAISDSAEKCYKSNHSKARINENAPQQYNDNHSEELSSELQGERNFVPTFNLAAYVDKSPTLQQLLQMGVDLSSIERRKGLAQFVLKLDSDQHIKPYLVFLNDQGVAAENFGELITKNPLLFKVEMDDLQTRINYLEAKKFSQRQVQRILTMNPFWLMFSTARIDRRLGYFQKEFLLAGDDVRFLATKQPRLITYNMEHVRKSTFSIREEMGFDRDELKCLLLSKPRLWMMQSDELVERFAYAHQQMELSHNMLIQFPEILTSRLFRLKQRHEFLKMLGRAQYDPEKDLYISPKAVIEGTDSYFAKNIAKSDMETYRMFLRTR